MIGVMENKEVHLYSQMGLQLRIPNRIMFLRPNIDFGYQQRSWAERRRLELRWILKKRIAFRNSIIKLTLKVITFPLPLLLAYTIAYFFLVTVNYRGGIMLGILLAEIIIIGYIGLWEFIGCINSDPDKVQLKR